MGSKRSMLRNGLGELLTEQSRYVRRFVDLFCGAGSVSWFVAETLELPVLAADLQEYAVVMARAVIERSAPLNAAQISKKWLEEVRLRVRTSWQWENAIALADRFEDICDLVSSARQLCELPSDIGPIWGAYGGHYFSPAQAILFDFMLKHSPQEEPERSVCLAATISAASKCAAAPGHTAQPLQPTETAGKYIMEAWKRDPLLICEKELIELCPKHSTRIGKAVLADAIHLTPGLNADDLVFVDPPYSGVQYSRFYHVLETMVRAQPVHVSGVGRYPAIEERPQSDFSRKGQSRQALEQLLISLSKTGSTVIFTFPEGECSNGLAGNVVIETASKWFHVTKTAVDGQFSTLGGNNSKRASRKFSQELILLLRPRGVG